MQERGEIVEDIQQIVDLIDESDRIFRSSAGWETKYDMIFHRRIYLDSKMRAAGIRFHWYDPDTSYEADVTAYMTPLLALREELVSMLDVD